MRSLILLTTLIAITLTACAENKSEQQTATPQTDTITTQPTNGVAFRLAQQRRADIDEVTYALDITIPGKATKPILAEEIIQLTLNKVEQDLQLDFHSNESSIKNIIVNDSPIEVDHRNEHVIIPAQFLEVGDNQIALKFTMGDTSLNRNPNYLYTLFVPDRARTAFPLFDQPNLKAHYQLTLNLPTGWKALSNAPVQSINKKDERTVYEFETTDLISSYLFSFVAGEFQEVTKTINGREMTLLHRETNPEKISRNLDAIFQAHADALSWLEDYTGIDYPFQKFDFAAIPAFQYGGMEHVGAIQYRASTLFLDADPSAPALLNRANLIAHETAHMWFGNLVTMDWFNDVWTKEVFANFMAAKMVNPSFPDIDHDLNFLLRSYPAAYSVDRTQGANAIRQDLPNLNEAGTLYGAIIYNKAPIMMQQLELLLGEEAFRQGIREYLATYANRNATWPDLISILDKRSEQDLKSWSETWVNTPGRPVFAQSQDLKTLTQSDPDNQNRLWPQQFNIRTESNNSPTYQTIQLFDHQAALPQREDILFNANGNGYGLFPVNADYINSQWGKLSDLEKGVQIVALFDPEKISQGRKE